MRPPYSVLARRMGPGGAGAPRGARDVTNPNPNPASKRERNIYIPVIIKYQNFLPLDRRFGAWLFADE